MKLIYGIIMLLFALTIAKADQVIQKYHFSANDIVFQSSKISNNMQQIQLKECLLAGKAGNPALPYHSISLLLPPGEEAVSVKIVKTKKETINGSWQIAPMQYSKPLSSDTPLKFIKNETLYNTNALFPNKSYSSISTAYMNGHSFALSTFTPFEYNPKTGKLNIFTDIEIQIETSKSLKSTKALKNLNSSAEILSRVKLLAQNDEYLALYPKTDLTENSYKILIITSNEYTTNFGDLVNFYNARGLKTKIKATEEIYSSISGDDNQDKIRNYIKQEYQTNGVLYVLLGGDIEILPYRGFYCQVQSSSVYEDDNIPADLYYSGLDGTWNDNNDNKWAEIGEDDILPDISVARFSFSNETELASMIEKSITYQASPVESELRKPLLVGENLYDAPETWGNDYLELLIGHHEDNGYTTDGIPADQDIQKMYDEVEEWSSYDLMDKINEGTIFLDHVGHSNSTYTMKFNIYDINSSNFSGANGVDHSYPVLYSHGCICGAFDEDDCIGEKMVSIDNFASAFVCNSRYGWFNEGQTEGPSEHLNREFINAVYNLRKSRIGEAHLISKIATSPWVNAAGQHEEGALRWCFYDANVLGDPAMSMWSDTPVDIDVTHEYGNDPMNDYVVKVIDENANTLSNIDCAIINDGTIIGYGITNENGEAPIDFMNYDSGEMILAISGYNTYLETYNITLPTVGIEDSNENMGTYLYANYPNPFNPTTSISFNLAKNTAVKLSVFNTKGETVANLINKVLNNGIHKFNFDASSLNSGVYYYTLETKNTKITKKMLLVK